MARERPVDPEILAILRAVDDAARAQQVLYFVGGALARDVLLFHVFGNRTGRATRDVDVMVCVDGWPTYAALTSRLLGKGFTAVAGRAHQVRYPLAGSRHGIPVDILPFGGVEHPAGTVAWPPDSEVVLRVVGFEEAAATAIEVALDDSLSAPFASPPALAMLKLSAWVDRHVETDKDAVDLLLLMRLNHAAGNEDRLYGLESPTLARAGFDPELAGAILLGRDVSLLCARQTKQMLVRSIAPLRTELGDQMLGSSLRLGDEAVAARVRRLLEAFWDGFTRA